MSRLWAFFLLFSVFYAPCLAAIDSVEQKKIEMLAERIRIDYAPDKRVDVFNLYADSLQHYFLETTNSKASEAFMDYYRAERINTPVNVQHLPAAILGNKIFGLINVSVGNMRTTPSNAAEMATQALLGWQVDILKKQDAYYLIRTPDGYISWLDAAAVTLKSKTEVNEWNKGQRVVFIADYGHVYTAPDVHSLRVSDLVMGNILKYEDHGNPLYYKVFFPDGREGYVAKDLVADYSHWKRSLKASAASILEIAKKMMGVPYLWGGTSIKGVDCSGFTKTAYFMNGMVIPRDASQQVQAGLPIDILTDNQLDTLKLIANLEHGDLLFFAADKGSSVNARITHVALYIGNGQFIHASGKVRINSLLVRAPDYDDFQRRTLVAARRYLGYVGSSGINALE